MLLNVYQNLQKNVFPNIRLDSDHQIIELILAFTISIMRMQKKAPIENIQPLKGSLKYQGFVFRFMAKFTEESKLRVEQTDVTYLANKIMSCDNEQVGVFYDNDSEIENSIRVKRFVEKVSEHIHWNFQKIRILLID